MQTFTIKIDRRNDQKQVVCDKVISDLRVETVWDSHGDLIQHAPTKHYKNAHIVITRHSWEERFSEKDEYTAYYADSVTIDGEAQTGEVYEVWGTTANLLLTLCVGYG